MRYAVFGGGMQGELVARNLAGRRETERVVLADVRTGAGGALPGKCVRRRCDVLSRRDVDRVSRSADAAVLAVPSAIARRALANLIDAGLPTADISFTPEPPLDWGPRARRASLPVILDCGLAPGLSHVLAAAAHRELGGLDSLRIYVGGIPLRPPPVFLHAVYFNARDLLAEYIRPARMRKGGRDVSPHPLDAPVGRLRDPVAGPLEAFPSDGLRTLLDSMPRVPDMAELTLRHPGHLESMRALRAAALLEGDAATDSLAGALAAKYPAREYPDRVVMEVRARRGSRSKAFRLHAVAGRQGGALARSTAYTGAAVAALLGRGLLAQVGVHPPEAIGQNPALAAALLRDLGAHGLAVERTGSLRRIA